MACVEAADETVWSHCPPVAQMSVLLVSTGRSDAEMFRTLLDQSNARLTAVRTYHEAFVALRKEAFAVVVCDERLPDGSWKDLLGLIAPLTEAPRMVVIAPEFREALYAEVFNLGAWELLLRPLKAEEVRRLLQVGCEKFAERRGPGRATLRTSRAAAAS
jgi:DNA-binding NtrC family response regulator